MSEYEKGLNKGIELAYKAMLDNMNNDFTNSMHRSFLEKGLKRAVDAQNDGK